VDFDKTRNAIDILQAQVGFLTHRMDEAELGLASLNERTGCLMIDKQKEDVDEDLAIKRWLIEDVKRLRAGIIKVRDELRQCDYETDTGLVDIMKWLDELLEGGE
jgi:hypothetical protein